MRPLHWSFVILGLIVIAIFLIPAIWGPQQGLREAGEIPMMDSNVLKEMAQEGEIMGVALSWAVVGFAVMLQIIAWGSAVTHFRKVKKSGAEVDEQLEQLDAIDVYFDLPLYFGLLGTVLAFVLVTIFPDAGLMFAYVSTALGIVMAVILRLSYLTPYRQELIALHKRRG